MSYAEIQAKTRIELQQAMSEYKKTNDKCDTLKRYEALGCVIDKLKG